MRNPYFSSLRFIGAPFSNATTDLMVETAREMYRQQKKVMAFASGTIQGEVRTEFKSYRISSAMQGVQFHAVIECSIHGTTKVDFLVEEQNLASDGRSIGHHIWDIPVVPAGHPSRSAHLN